MQPPIEIALDLCRPSPTARPVLPAQVIILAASIREIGLRQPISVRPLGDGYEIRGGGHRVAAFRELGYSTIPAFVCDDDDLHAELAEIDENLVRNELSPAVRSIVTARRKAIYEALHPETAAGGDRRSSRQPGDLKPDDGGKPAKPERFSRATAEAIGASERTVQRDASRGEALGPDVLSRVAGTALDSGEQIDALIKLTPERRSQLIARAESGEPANAVAAVKAEKRETKERDLGAKTTALPKQKFNVIYADPPWKFEPYSRETGMDRAADNHYPTMDLQGICEMAVPGIAADDCVLFLWATAPMMMEAIYVANAWGFLDLRPVGDDYRLKRDADGTLADFNPRNRYVSQQVWGKDMAGTGYWFRNKHELLLVCVRGHIPAPLPGTQMESLLNAAVRDHSRKPVIFRGMIEGFFPNLPKIELFARTPAPGWHQWGKEAPPQVMPSPDDDDTSGDKREAALMTAHVGDDNDGVISAPDDGLDVRTFSGGALRRDMA